jgi:hypothetical protein
MPPGIYTGRQAKDVAEFVGGDRRAALRRASTPDAGGLLATCS